MLAMAAGAVVACVAAEGERTLAGEGWRFMRDAAGDLQAQGTDFDDSAWEQVRVPHDWAISGPFDETKYGGTGKLPCGIERLSGFRWRDGVA